MKLHLIITFSVFLVLANLQANSQPTWSVNDRMFENSMNITGVILMNGEESINAGNKVGTFVGDECRGVGNVSFVPSLNRYIVFLTVYGNQAGEQLSFKIFWQKTSQIFNIDIQLEFVTNKIAGTPEQPFMWNIVDVPIEGETKYVNGCQGSSYEIFSQIGCIDYKWNTGTSYHSIVVTQTGTYSCVRKINDTTRIIDYWIVDLQAIPLVNLGPDTTICLGDELHLNAQNQGMEYLWNSNHTNQIISVSSSGNYQVQVISSNGCIGEDDINVTAVNPPIVNLGNDTTLAVGDTILLNAQNQGSTYFWNTGFSSQILPVTESGTFSVIVTNEFGCSTRDEISITENNSSNYQQEISACEGDTLEIDATFSNAIGYLWNSGEITPTLSITQSTNKTVEISLSDGSSFTGQYNIIFHSTPTIYIPDTINSCMGSKLNLDAQNDSCSYLWNTGDTTPIISVNQTGNYSIELTNHSGCKSQKNIFVEFQSATIFSFGSDIIETCSDNPIELNPQITNVEYLWSTGDTSQTIIPSETGLYSLTITNKGGCKSSDQTYVIIETNETRFINKTIMEGTTCLFYENELNQSGIYTYIDSSFSCPKKIVLNLNVLQANETFGKLTGNLEYEESEQLGGALLLLYSTDKQNSIATQTQSNGYFSFDAVPSGSYILCAMASHLNLPGMPHDCYYNSTENWEEASTISIEAGITTDVNFTLSPSGNEYNFPEHLLQLHSITGNIIFLWEGGSAGIYLGHENQSANLTPQNATRIVLQKLQNDGFSFFRSVLSDQKGEYQFQNVPPGNYLIEADIPGLMQQDSIKLHLEEVGTHNLVNLKVIEDISISTKESNLFKNVRIYPNPCNNALQIEIDGTYANNYLLKVFDLSGRCLIHKKMDGFRESIKTQNLNSGIYILQIADNEVNQFKFVVK